MAVNGTHCFEREKTYTDKTKLNPAARDDTLRSKDTKRSVCARNWTVFISFFTSDPPHCPTVLSAVTTAGAWHVFFLLYGESQTNKCITATYLSNGPLTLSTISIRRVGIRTVGQCSGSEVKNDINTVRFLAQTNRFVSLDLNVSSRAAGFNLVLSVYVCFFFSQSLESHWLPLYDWQTATVWVKNFVCVILKKQSHLHLGCPWGKQINIKFSFLGELSL